MIRLICTLALFVSFAGQSALAKSVTLTSKQKILLKEKKKNRKKIDKLLSAEKNRSKKILKKLERRQKAIAASKKFDPRRAKVAKAKIEIIANEFRKAKTVKEWINNSPEKIKIQRHKQFAKYGNKKIPKILISGTSIAVLPERKSGDTYTIVLNPTKSGVKFLVNGVDKTRKKGETFRSWQKRSGLKISSDFNIINLLIPRAHAYDINSFAGEELFVSMFSTSYLNGEWASRRFEEGSYKNEEYQRLIAGAMALRTQNGLSCSDNNFATFSENIGGYNVPLKVSTDATGTMVKLEMYKDRSYRERIGSFGGAEHTARAENFSSVSGQNSYPLTEMVGAVGRSLRGESIPERENFITSNRPSQAEVLTSIANARACSIAVNAGVDVSACDASGSYNAYSDCIKSNVLGSDLQSSGLLSGLRRSDGALTEMDRQQAVIMKIQILNAYAQFQTRFNTDAPFPERDGAGYILSSPGNFRSSSVRDLLAHDQSDDAFHEAVMSCYEEALNARKCDSNLLNNDVIDQIFNFSQPISNAMVGNSYSVENAPTVSDLLDEAESLSANIPSQCSALLNEDRMKALNNFAVEDVLFNDRSRNVNIREGMISAVIKGDVAKMCCSNAQCSEQINSVGSSNNVPSEANGTPGDALQ